MNSEKHMNFIIQCFIVIESGIPFFFGFVDVDVDN